MSGVAQRIPSATRIRRATLGQAGLSKRSSWSVRASVWEWSLPPQEGRETRIDVPWRVRCPGCSVKHPHGAALGEDHPG